MLKILLVGDTLQSINVAWRHFVYSEYAAKATTLVSGAMSSINGDDPPDLVVYYAADESSQLFSLYREMREGEDPTKVPLLILADAHRQKALSDYFTFKNAEVVGISVDDRMLLDKITKLIEECKTS